MRSAIESFASLLWPTSSFRQSCHLGLAIKLVHRAPTLPTAPTTPLDGASFVS
jgi:hypothetical protein